MIEHATTRRLGSPARASGTTGEGVERSRILIQLRNKPDRDLVQETLSGSYEIILPAAEPAQGNGNGRLKIIPMAELERQTILSAITELHGDKLQAARLLGIGKTTLYRKLKDYAMQSYQS